MRKHHAVFGTPISHSLSPRIHAAFARQCGIELDYLAIEADAGDFRAKLDDFAAHGGTGANVTLPLKEAAFALCSEASERARRAGAVNTLVRAGDGWHGDNTDGAGLVRDLTGRHMLDLRARRTLLLGAGGAARGIAPALLEAGIGELTIVNRTPERADALADALGEPGRVHPRYLGDLAALGEFDLIVNATSAARGGQLPALPRSLVGRRCAAVDLSYGEAAIPFLAWARANGCHDAVDGLGMLVEQAAESFALWLGTRPETDGVYAELSGRAAALVTAD
ncbi:shikimate dehydrogenase [Thermomonas sp.]|jgi:shikimate dehydrogenase|uniref:shikimate dehydrogenase n=2 Tax=Thermomonas sp. TaxID=1971895 RepID=UPI001ECBF248|nr:shikimate dehydrogenase [Thermomonas sp.]MBK6415414.1 shikimate dehydrogenase [Thermomonas sp.]MBL0228528.1 shikimate dehydrogenase [Thermomonas sp.]HQY82279.1 shikimate dehydrogenase [Thermomonas sp.]HRA02669.1 shikimate dehydrogenase [Thermomonas sp.]